MLPCTAYRRSLDQVFQPGRFCSTNIAYDFVNGIALIGQITGKAYRTADSRSWPAITPGGVWRAPYAVRIAPAYRHCFPGSSRYSLTSGLFGMSGQSFG